MAISTRRKSYKSGSPPSTNATATASSSSPSSSTSSTPSPKKSGRKVSDIDEDIASLFNGLHTTLPKLDGQNTAAARPYVRRISSLYDALLRLLNERIEATGGDATSTFMSSNGSRAIEEIDGLVLGYYAALQDFQCELIAMNKSSKKAKKRIDSHILENNILSTLVSLRDLVQERVAVQQAMAQQEERESAEIDAATSRLASATLDDSPSTRQGPDDEVEFLGTSNSSVFGAGVAHGDASLSSGSGIRRQASTPTTTPLSNQGSSASGTPTRSVLNDDSSLSVDDAAEPPAQRLRLSTGAGSIDRNSSMSSKRKRAINGPCSANDPSATAFASAPSPAASTSNSSSPFGQSHSQASPPSPGLPFAIPPCSPASALANHQGVSTAQPPASRDAPAPNPFADFEPTRNPENDHYLESITAMPGYENVSFEELRLQYYQAQEATAAQQHAAFQLPAAFQPRADSTHNDSPRSDDAVIAQSPCRVSFARNTRNHNRTTSRPIVPRSRRSSRTRR